MIMMIKVVLNLCCGFVEVWCGCAVLSLSCGVAVVWCCCGVVLLCCVVVEVWCGLLLFWCIVVVVWCCFCSVVLFLLFLFSFRNNRVSLLLH